MGVDKSMLHLLFDEPFCTQHYGDISFRNDILLGEIAPQGNEQLTFFSENILFFKDLSQWHSMYIRF